MADLKKPRFRQRKDFRRFLMEIDGMPEFAIREIMGGDYIDTPGYYRQEARHYGNDVVYFMQENMGRSELARLEEYWENNIKDK
jgi:hypothetical protein